MTDPTGLPPEQEAVRRLLADAHHDGPTPPEVVARLDATLASLAAERTESSSESSSTSSPASSSAGTRAPVVDLGARRRRMAGVGLLAAAAVVVAGVAIGQGLPIQGSSDSGSAAGGDTATSQRETSEDAGGGSDAGSDAGSEESGEAAPESLKSGSPAPLATYPTLSSGDDDLDEDLLTLRSQSYDSQSAETLVRDLRAGCDLRGTGPGRRVLAEVDGRVGAVVFRRADGASQQVDLYLCGEPTAVRTLTLPAP